VTEQPEAVATPVEDSPKAQEIKAELAHLDDIEATLPAHEDAGDEPEADEAEHHEGTPHRKKRRHR
jgi:hypothetical protein